MSNTLVLQSHRQPLPAKWIQTCLDSVKNWAEINNFDYKLIGDELFDYVSDSILRKTKSQLVIATDLARLKAIKSYLAEGYDIVVWCDADFVIFNPNEFKLPDENYVVGREIWIQYANDNPKKLTAYVKVHNAFMMYREGNSFLEFYVDTAERLLISNKGSMSPQFIGPKLLTAINNIAQCPVIETAGMLSPLVVKDIANDGGLALELFQKKSSLPIAAANLCGSMYEKGDVSEYDIDQCIDRLLMGLFG